jgi:hypothetical protein
MDDAGVFGLATDKGEIDKAIGKIIGFHAPNMLVIVDEMPYTPEAIVEACVNLESGSSRFQFIGIGNARITGPLMGECASQERADSESGK